jgi:flagellar hook-basal body complex protein FliE
VTIPITGVNPPLAGTGALGSGPTQSSGNFSDTLKETLDEITRLQSAANRKVAGLVSGNGEDLPSTMIAVEQANVAFELMVEVRNKIVQAYQEISQMSF